MASPVIKVTGLKPVLRKMQRLGVEVSDLKDTFRGLGLLVADAAQGLAPRLSGDLVRSIKPGRLRKNAASVQAGNARVPYAAVIHYGGGVGPGRRGPHNIGPHPFLLDAVLAKRGQVVRELEQGLDSLIRRLDLK